MCDDLYITTICPIYYFVRGGTFMKSQCYRCGFELLEGEDVCPNCGYSERKKPFYLILFAVSLVALVAMILATFGVFSKSITYTITPKFSDAFLGKSAQEFCETDGEGTIFYNNLKTSYVDDNGNLIVKLTEEQNENIRKECFSKIQKTKDQLIYSSDYTDISVYVFQETCAEKSIVLGLNLRFFAMAQLLNGVEVENIKVNYKIIDAGTYEELVSYTWSSLEGNANPDEISIEGSSITSKDRGRSLSCGVSKGMVEKWLK